MAVFRFFVCLFLLLLSSASFALDNGEFTYTIIDDGIEITGCVNEICPQNMVIPSEIQGHTVLEIGISAFQNSGIISLNIPASVLRIGKEAFRYNNIESLNLSDNLLTIGTNAFSTNRIKFLQLGNSITTITEGVFTNNNIHNLVIPDNVTRIDRSAFSVNPFNKVVFGHGLVSIGELAFGYGSSGRSITALFLGDMPRIISGSGNESFSRYSTSSKIYHCGGKDWSGSSITFSSYSGIYVISQYYDECTLDTDLDGKINFIDLDDDNDGVHDDFDAFPLLATEHQDSDSDGVGNNADSDDDNDGVVDVFDALPLDAGDSIDTDSDGMGNNIDQDDDGDGVADVIDTFPLDPNESSDSDGDGVGDNADFFPISAEYTLDSDLDQMPDAWERKYGLNPTDASDAVMDHDGDGLTALEEYEAGTIPLKILDIDANGSVDALTDGLMVLRYLFGLRGQGLISNGTASDAMRTEAADIEAYIQSLMPGF